MCNHYRGVGGKDFSRTGLIVIIEDIIAEKFESPHEIEVQKELMDLVNSKKLEQMRVSEIRSKVNEARIKINRPWAHYYHLLYRH